MGSNLGKKIIAGMSQLLDDLRAGRPVKQTVVRRMKVKGKTVFTHESFTAPIRKNRRSK